MQFIWEVKETLVEAGKEGKEASFHCGQLEFNSTRHTQGASLKQPPQLFLWKDNGEKYVHTDSHQSSFEDAPGVLSPALWDGLL